MPIKVPKHTGKSFPQHIVSNNKHKKDIEKWNAKLFIDSITVGINFEKTQEAADLHSNIWSMVADTSAFQQMMTVQSYSRSWRLVLQSVSDPKHYPVLMYRYDKPFASRLAIYFHPVDLGSKGMADLHSILVSVVDDGWGSFLDRGIISKLEVSIDLSGIDINDIHPLPVKSTTAKTYSNDGKLQSIYMGKKTGNQWRIYDKTAHRKSQGQHWHTGTRTRIERIAINLGIKVIDLPKIDNPFLNLELLEIPLAPPPSLPESKHYIWEGFCALVQIKGLQSALKRLPKASYRPMFRGWVMNQQAPYWNPAEIWKQWIPMLKDTDILKGN